MRPLAAVAGGLLAPLLPLLAACGDDTYDSPVPEPDYIHYTCNIETINAIAGQTAGQAQLMSPGGYVCIYDPHLLSATDAPGVAGLLLLQGLGEAGRYYAYDLACPYCYTQGATLTRIAMLSDGLNAACDVCGSRYGGVQWGSAAPTAGPANAGGYPLRQYRATLLPDGHTLVVTR